MRLIFMGYHNVGCACLETLIELCRGLGDEIVAVVTHEDDPREGLWFASVAKAAFDNYLPVYQPRDPNDPAFVAVLKRLEADFLFSCYYRHMLKRPVLELPRLGALNMHGSLLPRYRGRCPVNWVLVNGETETGVTLHYMEEKADQGDIVGAKRVPITPEDTALTLFARLTVAAGALMRECYPLLRTGRAPRAPQDHAQASYFGGRTAGRRPHPLAAIGPADLQFDAGRDPPLPRGLHFFPGEKIVYLGRQTPGGPGGGSPTSPAR